MKYTVISKRTRYLSQNIGTYHILENNCRPQFTRSIQFHKQIFCITVGERINKCIRISVFVSQTLSTQITFKGHVV